MNNAANFEQIYNAKTGPGYKPCAVDEYLNLKNATDYEVFFELFQSRECVKTCPPEF